MSKPLFFVLPTPDAARVLMQPGPRGPALPAYDRSLETAAAFDDPEPFNQWFAQRLGVVVRRVGASRFGPGRRGSFA